MSTPPENAEPSSADVEPLDPDRADRPDEGRDADVMPTWLTISVIVVVLALWAANILIGFFAPTKTNPAVNPAFMLILGYLFVRTGVVGQIRGRRTRDDKRDRPGGGQ